MTTAIRVEGLGKSYLLRHEQAGAYATLREELADRFNRIGRRILSPFAPREHRSHGEVFWALRNLSFKVEEGERLGIIGRNGAGKSTLLKVLSRITEPTEGRIEVRGKLSSLLEVGTGFHPELTGRENIFLNGAILGMSSRQIRRQFDAIVEFAEVERFLDTPVKRYSSGMYVRLAFSVAAHLEPEILVVDEVLAVGDAEFQRKCLGKMREAGSSGQTVLFVSHQMAAIQKLCDRCILLSGGELKIDGPPDDVVREYLATGGNVARSSLLTRGDRRGTQRLKFAAITLIHDQLASGVLKIVLAIANPGGARLDDLKVSVDVYDVYGSHISNLTNYVVGNRISVSRSDTEVDLIIREINLMPGNYSLNLFMAADRHNSEILDWVEDAGRFEIPERDIYGTGVLPPVKSGVVLMNYQYVVR